MKFIDLRGRSRNLRNAKKYRIDWDKPSRSKFQTQVKEFLYPYWQHEVVFEEMLIVGTRLSLDFYNANRGIAIEVQGGQHLSYVKHFHRDRLAFRDQLKRDEDKAEFCLANDILLIEVYPTDKIDLDFFSKHGLYL